VIVTRGVGVNFAGLVKQAQGYAFFGGEALHGFLHADGGNEKTGKGIACGGFTDGESARLADGIQVGVGNVGAHALKQLRSEHRGIVKECRGCVK
jgi:hypothetical protein